MKRVAVLVWSLTTGTLGGLGCVTNERVNEDTYRFKFLVQDEQGATLPEVKIFLGKREVGHTDASGTLLVQQRGREGQDLVTRAECPRGFRGPELPEKIRLSKVRALEDDRSQGSVQVDFSCERETRDVVVVVQARGGGNLPLRIGTDSVANTDSDGNAQLVLHLDRNQTELDLGLDTEARRGLMPKNPSRHFSFGRGDLVLLFHEELTQAKARPRALRKPKQVMPRRPVRLD